MYRNDRVIPFFTLLFAVALFFIAYLDGRHITALAGGKVQPLSVGQIGLISIGIVLLVYAVIGYVSVWLEGRELRPGTHPAKPGGAQWVGMALSALAVALSGLFAQSIIHSLRTQQTHPAVEGALFGGISLTVAGILALYKRY
ncbi:MAG: hypothetical protein P8Z81_12490, partial [Deinococcales bacterium]